jgi:Condensation domain
VVGAMPDTGSAAELPLAVQRVARRNPVLRSSLGRSGDQIVLRTHAEVTTEQVAHRLALRGGSGRTPINDGPAPDQPPLVRIEYELSDDSPDGLGCLELRPHPAIRDRADWAALVTEIRRELAILHWERLPLTVGLGQVRPSLNQERLWFIEQFDGMPSAKHNIVIRVDVATRLDPERLRDALRYVLARHDVLRSRFSELDGIPSVAIVEAEPVLHVRSSADASETVADLGRAFAREPIDIEYPPLLRCLLVQNAARSVTSLFLAVHHIAGDAASLELVLKDLSAAYQAPDWRKAAEASRPAIQFYDYAVWHRARFESAYGQQQVGMWREWVTPVPDPLGFPSLGNIEPLLRGQLSDEGGDEGTVLTSWGIASLARRSASLEVSPYMLCLAMYAIQLYALTGARRIVIGTPMENRVYAATRQLIGFFANSLPLIVDIGDDLTATLSSAKHATSFAIDHQEVPLQAIVAAAGLSGSGRDASLLQVTFSYQSHTLNTAAFAGHPMRYADIDTSTAKFDLTLKVAPRNDDILINYIHRLSAFTPTAARRLADGYARGLARILDEVPPTLDELAELMRP